MNKYLFNQIIEYIPINIKIKLNLFKYSKLFQKKFDIDLNDYKYEYFKLIFYAIYNNIFKSKRELNIEIISKKKLYEELENELKENNLSINELIDIHQKYFEKNKTKPKNIYLKLPFSIDYYDIYNPFTYIFFDFYDINLRIPLSSIKKYNLLEDYISFFINKKCEQLFIEFEKIDDIKILKKINLDFSKLRKLTVKEKEKDDYEECELDDFSSFKNKRKMDFKLNDFYSKIFSIFKTSYNLEYLYFDPYSYECGLEQCNPSVLKPLNNLKNLTYIQFGYINLSEPFTIMLPNLEKVSFHSCKNIYLCPKISTKNMGYLKLEYYKMELNYKYKFDNLEELYFRNLKHQSLTNINYIDYTSLKKLKSLETINVDLIINILKYTSIEKIEFDNDFSILFYGKPKLTLEDEIKIYESILYNKTLKEIKLFFYKISNEDLKKYENVICNNTLNKIVFINKKNNFDYTYFLKKFTCLKEIEINNYGDIYEVYLKESKENKKNEYIKLKNDKTIIIEQITIYSNLDLILSFSFSKIKSIDLKGEFNMDSFSLFKDICNDIFYSLEYLSIETLRNKTIFNNLVNNLKNCKNLKQLIIPIDEITNIKQFDKKTIYELVNKFLSLKIRYLRLCNSRFYNPEKLNDLFPNKIPKEYKYLIPNFDYN